MVGQFLRGGIRAVPAGLQLSKLLLSNQGVVGTLGFLGGFRGIGTGSRGVVARFLDAACAGDEVGMRRRLVGRGAHLQRRRSSTERRRPVETSLRSAVAQAHRIRACRRRSHRARRAAQRDLHRGRFRTGRHHQDSRLQRSGLNRFALRRPNGVRRLSRRRRNRGRSTQPKGRRLAAACSDSVAMRRVGWADVRRYTAPWTPMTT